MTDAPIAYILKRYPRFSETFVVNEILAHEAAGQAIEIYALGPVQETHFQEAIARVRAPVRRIRHQYHDTELYWQLLTKAHATLPAFDANAALAENHSAATIGQAAVLALKIHERGIRHLHGRPAPRRRPSPASPRALPPSPTASPHTPKTSTTNTANR